MKKSEFKKMMKKENKAFKNYYIYETIFILLLAIVFIPDMILMVKNMIPISTMLMDVFLILIMAIPGIIIDLGNDMEINRMHKSYLEENQIPEYKGKEKALKVMIVVGIAVVIVNTAIMIPICQELGIFSK